MILSFKSELDNQLHIVGEGVLMYDGMKEQLEVCKNEMKINESDWKACYHFADVRLYPRTIPYDELKENLSSFNEGLSGKAVLSPDDYTRLLTLTETTQ